MKIAYLITAYGEFGHLKRLVDALDAPDVGFFIHVDAKSTMPDDLFRGRENVWFAPRIKVWWGGWSHVEAILSLMREAARGDYDYCALLSGGDYPIRSNQTIAEVLGEGGEFINASPGFRSDKPEKRVRNYHLNGRDSRGKSLKNLLFTGIEIALRTLGVRKRNYPFERVYAGMVWSALSMGCIRYILDYVESNPRFVSFFRTARIPEEFFFHTIVGNSPYADGIRGTLTYMDWNGAVYGPNFISEGHLPALAPGTKFDNKYTGRAFEPMFARKFDDRSGKVLDMIDKQFRVK